MVDPHLTDERGSCVALSNFHCSGKSTDFVVTPLDEFFNLSLQM